MCIDDYEFKHYSSFKERICRRLHFLNQDEDEQIFLVNIAQFQQQHQFDFSRVLYHLTKKGLVIEDHKFYIQRLNLIINPHFSTMIRYQDFQQIDQVIHILKLEQQIKTVLPFQLTFMEVQSQQSLSQKHLSDQSSPMKTFDQSPSSHSDILHHHHHHSSDNKSHNHKIHNKNEHLIHHNYHHKKMKQPQRMIGEVIRQVKSWRLLHQVNHLSLGEAAKLVGVAKKSLDDYYLILRIAEYSDFDFQANLDRGMGEIRSFVKKTDCKRQGRLPIETKHYKMFNYVKQTDILQSMQNQDFLQFKMKPSISQ